MASLPIIQIAAPTSRDLPDYLPARMVNQFVYCPRLFFYEWVDGVFRESADTLEGSAQHKRVDRPGKGLAAPDELGEEKAQTRSITLSSERHRLIAKLDLLDVADGAVVPVDYKHGRPFTEGDSLAAWPSERVQMAAQAIVLRENGYRCDEAVIFYQGTRQRVRIPVTPELIVDAEAAISAAWQLARYGSIPPPLFASPKCPGCSLAPVCLPDEVTQLRDEPSEATQLDLFSENPMARKPIGRETRRLLAARDDLRPLYLDTQGYRVGRSGAVLQVKAKETTVAEVRINDVSQVNLLGNIQITTQAVQSLCEAGIPVSYFSQGGWFYGITSGLNTKNVFLRQRQFSLAGEGWFCRRLARQLVAGKIRNARTFLQRNHIEPDSRLLASLKDLAERAESGSSLEELLGIEGLAARHYFGAFPGLIKVDDEEGMTGAGGFTFDFEGRNRRPPRDPVNALLSLGYSMLAKDFTIACYAVGFDPMMGFYHQPRFGRPALALDLMEPFRPLVVDSAVVSAINTRMVTPRDFLRVGESVALRPEGRKAFYRAYELRMDTLVTHPLFSYRVSYRRMLEIQTRLLAKMMEGEVPEYTAFVTR